MFPKGKGQMEKKKKFESINGKKAFDFHWHTGKLGNLVYCMAAVVPALVSAEDEVGRC